MKFDITIKDCTLAEINKIVVQLVSETSFGVALSRHAARVQQSSEPTASVTEVTHMIPPVYNAPFVADVTPMPVAPITDTYDASGLPWDERIHASTKTRTAKNLWTRRRGVDDALVAQIEAELRGVHQVAASIPDPSTVFNYAPQSTVNFASLTQRIAQGYATGKINADYNYPASLCARLAEKFNVQVNNITDIMNNQPMVEYANALMNFDNVC